MKKYITILLFSFFLCILLSACQSSNSGTSTSTVEELIGKSFSQLDQYLLDLDIDYFAYAGYYFFQDSQGYHCVVNTDNYGVVDVKTFHPDNVDTSADSFAQVKEGMTVYDVVSRVGIPTDTATFGMLTMVFSGEEGEYVVYWDYSGSQLTVQSINMRN